MKKKSEERKRKEGKVKKKGNKKTKLRFFLKNSLGFYYL